MERIVITYPGASGGTIETAFHEDDFDSWDECYQAAVEYAAGLAGALEGGYKVDGRGWEGKDRIGFDADVARHLAVAGKR